MDNTENPIPLALVRMLPHGRSAHLAAQVLAQMETVSNALGTLLHTKGHGGMDPAELSYTAGLVQDFRHVLAKETADIKASPATAPLTGTTSRSIVSAIADSVLTMPEPKPEDGGWRQAAHNQVWRTGTRYAQTWLTDATYWAYSRQKPEEEN